MDKTQEQKNAEWLGKTQERLTAKRVRDKGFPCCPTCKKEISWQDNFCSNCGQAIEW